MKAETTVMLLSNLRYEADIVGVPLFTLLYGTGSAAILLFILFCKLKQTLLPFSSSRCQVKEIVMIFCSLSQCAKMSLLQPCSHGYMKQNLLPSCALLCYTTQVLFPFCLYIDTKPILQPVCRVCHYTEQILLQF